MAISQWQKYSHIAKCRRGGRNEFDVHDSFLWSVRTVRPLSWTMRRSCTRVLRLYNRRNTMKPVSWHLQAAVVGGDISKCIDNCTDVARMGYIFLVHFQ